MQKKYKMPSPSIAKFLKTRKCLSSISVDWIQKKKKKKEFLSVFQLLRNMPMAKNSSVSFVENKVDPEI